MGYNGNDHEDMDLSHTHQRCSSYLNIDHPFEYTITEYIEYTIHILNYPYLWITVMIREGGLWTWYVCNDSYTSKFWKHRKLWSRHTLGEEEHVNIGDLWQLIGHWKLWNQESVVLRAVSLPFYRRRKKKELDILSVSNIFLNFSKHRVVQQFEKLLKRISNILSRICAEIDIGF